MNLNLSINYRTIAFFVVVSASLVLAGIFNLFPLPHEYGKQYYPQLILVVLLLSGYFIFTAKKIIISLADYIVLSSTVFGYCALHGLFYDTPFGLWAMQGDAGFNIAIITKYKYNNTLVDFNYKGLHCSYPSLYFFLLGKYAAVTNSSSIYMLKKGFLALYLFMPWISYNLLKKTFSERAAAITVTLFCFLFADFAIYKPAECFGLLIFIPWLLGLFRNEEHAKIKSVLINGLIGGFLFANYYFWFFIIPFVMISYLLIEKNKAPLAYIIKVLIVSAATSSFFWLPVLLDCLKYGMHSQITLWFDESMLVLYRSLDKVSVIQIIVLVGTVAIVTLKDIKNELKWLLLAFVFWQIIGQLSMLVQKPLVHSKMNHLGDLIMILGFAEAIIILAQKWDNYKMVVAALSAVLFILSAQSLLELRNNSGYQAAFVKYPENNWQSSEAFVIEYKDKVFLTEKTFLNQLLPVYQFINVNAHFSHPASQYLQRIAFLNQLQNCNDPQVILWLLKYNRFNSIDYIWPDVNNSITVYKDNFPYNHVPAKFYFSKQILDLIGIRELTLNSAYFSGDLYRLKEIPFGIKNQLNAQYTELINRYGL